MNKKDRSRRIKDLFNKMARSDGDILVSIPELTKLTSEISAKITESFSPFQHIEMPLILISLRSILNALEARFPEENDISKQLEYFIYTASAFSIEKGEK